MARRMSGALSFGVMLWLLGGCAGPTSYWRDLPPPTSLLTQSTAVWQKALERRQHVHDLKGVARVRVQTPEQSGTLDDVVVVLERRVALRLEGIGPLGQPLFLFLADHERLSLYAPQERRLFVGIPSESNAARLLGVALLPEVFQDLLLGDLPVDPLPAASPADLLYLKRENLYFWKGVPPEQKAIYKIWFEPYQLQPVRFEIRDMAGTLLLHVHYDTFQQVGELSMPFRITIEQPETNRYVVWQYNDVQLNTGVPPALFSFYPPAGTEYIAIEALQENSPESPPRIW